MRGATRFFANALIQWLPLAVLATLLCAMGYIIVQQNYRQSANDPQIQMALDARNALAHGATPTQLVPTTTIDISQSLAPYLIIYDTNAQVVAASATLRGQPLTPPHGVFTSATATGMDTLTWMPTTSVRNAIVVIPYSGGYILAGRSLQLVEQRESGLTQQVAAAYVITLLSTLLTVLFARLLATRLTFLLPQ